MTFLKKHFGNMLMMGLLIFVASKQVPLWIHSNKQIGKDFFKIKAVTLSGESLELPTKKSKRVYLFWATWCGPCHVQLAQFEKSISEGELSADQVVAVSLDKSLEDLKIFVGEKAYSFKVVQASSEQSWTDLNVQATPSIAFVDENNKVQNFFTGLSPLSAYKAKKFLN